VTRKPKHPPKGGRPAAERQFVDREEFIAPVHAALQEPQRARPLVLVYYGGAGIGKSRLRRELTRQLSADPAVLVATLDFHISIYRLPETALFSLRKTLRETYQVKFPSFDLAYAIYWQKSHPDTAMGEELKPLFESGSLLPQLLDESGKLPLIGLVPKINRAVRGQGVEDSRNQVKETPTSNLLPATSYLGWWEKRGQRELEDLPQMEPGAIVDRLPMLWAADLKDHLSGDTTAKMGTVPQRSFLRCPGHVRRSCSEGLSPTFAPESVPGDARVPTRRAVLFIDSYEMLWETGATEAGFFKRDQWVRELVKQLPEALWVICGRQKLRWEEVEADWDEALSQHQLQALPDPAARRFLESCDITTGQIQDAIVKGSQGVPHYLDLAVDTLERTKDKGQGTKLTGDSPDELAAQFTRQLDKPEAETLKVLSAARFWYYGLFEHLITQYQDRVSSDRVRRPCPVLVRQGRCCARDTDHARVDARGAAGGPVAGAAQARAPVPARALCRAIEGTGRKEHHRATPDRPCRGLLPRQAGHERRGTLGLV
jgi:hypothetical protein